MWLSFAGCVDLLWRLRGYVPSMTPGLRLRLHLVCVMFAGSQRSIISRSIVERVQSFASSFFCELLDRWRPYMEYVPYRLAALLSPYTPAIPLNDFISAKHQQVTRWDLTVNKGPRQPYRVYWYSRNKVFCDRAGVANTGSGRYVFRWWIEPIDDGTTVVVRGGKRAFVEKRKYFSVRSNTRKVRKHFNPSNDAFETRLDALNALVAFAATVDRCISEADIRRYYAAIPGAFRLTSCMCA
jgi:hypothetical protein